MLEPRVVAAERISGVEAARARLAHDVGGVPSDVDGKLLERCLIRKQSRYTVLLEPLLRVRGEGHAGLPRLAQAFRPEQREVHQARQGEQGLVRGDVRCRLLAPDVLLARLKGEDIAALARGVYRLADDPPREPSDVRVAGGEEPVVRAAVAHGVARRLSLADRERAAVVAGGLEHAEADQVDVRDRKRSRLVRDGGEFGCRLQTAEEVRLLEDHCRGIPRRLPHRAGIRDSAVVRNLDDLEPEPARERADDLAHLRVGRLGDDDAVAAGRRLGDEAGVGRHSRAVVARGVGDVHSGELADRGLVLEDRLQHALRQLGLVRRVRGEELAALQHRVDDRRDVVVVDPGAEERDLVDDVPRGELLQVPRELGLRRAPARRELPSEADAGRDVAEELLDRRDADRREHRLAVHRR